MGAYSGACVIDRLETAKERDEMMIDSCGFHLLDSHRCVRYKYATKQELVSASCFRISDLVKTAQTVKSRTSSLIASAENGKP